MGRTDSTSRTVATLAAMVLLVLAATNVTASSDKTVVIGERLRPALLEALATSAPE